MHVLQHLDKYPSKNIQITDFHALMTKNDAYMATLSEEDKVNLYFPLAHHTGAGSGNRPVRSKNAFAYQTIMAWDIDAVGAEQMHNWELYRRHLSMLLRVSTDHITAVCSGNGLHMYVHLKQPIKDAAFFNRMKPHYQALGEALTQKLEEDGLPGHVDLGVFDAARILRVPGSVNRKPGREDLRCYTLNYSDLVVDLDLVSVSGLGDFQEQNVSPAEVRAKYPLPDLEEIVKECRFVAWAVSKPSELHEPDAFDVFSVLACANGKVYAEDIFNKATSSLSLARTDFDRKWEQSSRYGCRKCSTIAARWSGCMECPYYGKIPTPLALRSKEHIGSANAGYWVYNARGEPSEPNYADLTRILVAQKHVFTSGSGSRIFAWYDTHYKPLVDLELINWQERMVTPSDPIKIRHRSELISKVKAKTFKTEVEEKELFDLSTRGRLNCANGVLDIRTGRMEQHSPSRGFKYVLPHNYDPDATSEYFYDWLNKICLERADVFQAIWDFMAYCVWPDYDDHVFAFLVGEGANGKSTLLKVLEAMVGVENCSHVSLKDLAGHKFNLADIEGKLMNLAGESSGTVLSSEHLNVIKELSAGETITIERKGLQGYSYQNRAKLLFCANVTPTFKEKDLAIQRRLLVIPFDYQITDTDVNVEKRLVAEAPAVLAMLVAHIQRKIAKDGRFKVTRDGENILAAQHNFLIKGDSAVEWARECWRITNNAADATTTDDTYRRYTEWCIVNGHKNPYNKPNFGSVIAKHVLGRPTATKWVEGKTVRVYTGVKYND